MGSPWWRPATRSGSACDDPAVPLLEREHPLQVLEEHARSAVAGRGSLVLVAGEAGIGKTVLLRTFAGGRPAVLWGMCDPLLTPRPFGPLRDVAAQLDPAVSGLLRAGAAQHEIFAAVLDALRGAPRVLVVEDLHWGDEATLDLVRFLARRIATLPLLLVLSYRDAVGVDHPLRTVLGDLVSSPDARRLQLTPLSRAAVARLVEGHDLDADDVHRRTAGNPFFVSQIVAQPDAPLPDSVRDAVVARITALAPLVRRRLELLSCTPEKAGAELLGALGVPPADVETLVSTGLLERQAHGVAFRHEIARSAVLGSVTPGSEPALHATMIDALEATGADASVLTHHAVAAGDVPRIRRYATAAGAEAARSGAHREAVAFYELALRHLGADRAARAALLEALSTELYLTDRLADAIEVRTQALDLRRALDDVVAVGAAHRTISYYQWYAADLAAAERQDVASHAILDGAGDDRERGYALANRSFLAAQRGDEAAAIGCGARAQRIADELADPALHGTAAIGIGIVRLAGGQLDAREQLIEAGRVGLRQGIDELATAPMSHLAHLDVEQGRLTEAEAVLVDALQLSEERDIPICSMWQRGVRARLLLLTGRWSEAEQDARAVLAAGNLPLSLLWPHLVLGLLAARRDAPTENPHLDEQWRIALRIDVPDKLAAAAAALAENAWVTRRADPRLADPRIPQLVSWSAAREHASGSLARWARRLAAAEIQELGPGAATRPDDDPYERALAQWDEGTTDGLLAALAELDDLGARAVAAHVRARLRERGVAVVPRGPLEVTRANPAGLTARQLDVLALLVDGLSNADIARRLVISRKTADHHVSAILAKLAVRSRGEAVAAARRLGVGVLSG